MDLILIMMINLMLFVVKTVVKKNCSIMYIEMGYAEFADMMTEL